MASPLQSGGQLGECFLSASTQSKGSRSDQKWLTQATEGFRLCTSGDVTSNCSSGEASVNRFRGQPELSAMTSSFRPALGWPADRENL